MSHNESYDLTKMTHYRYVDTKDMARRACEVVTKEELKIIPKEHEKTWFRWLEDSRPWPRDLSHHY